MWRNRRRNIQFVLEENVWTVARRLKHRFVAEGSNVSDAWSFDMRGRQEQHWNVRTSKSRIWCLPEHEMNSCKSRRYAEWFRSDQSLVRILKNKTSLPSFTDNNSAQPDLYAFFIWSTGLSNLSTNQSTYSSRSGYHFSDISHYLTVLFFRQTYTGRLPHQTSRSLFRSKQIFQQLNTIPW